MREILAALTMMALLAGCSGTVRRSVDSGEGDLGAGKEITMPPNFALPGVPLRDYKEEPEKKPASSPSGSGTVEVEPVDKKSAPSSASAEPVYILAPADKAKNKTAATAATDATPSGGPAPAAAVKPAPAADPRDLKFHLSAARRYYARKKYLSAAAEFKAAARFLPAGDALAVYLLERRGAMLLRAGQLDKAQEDFKAAIAKAGEVGSSGEDLANAYLGLGYCQERTGKTAEAVGNYQKAMAFTSRKMIKARLADTIAGLKKKLK